MGLHLPWRHQDNCMDRHPANHLHAGIGCAHNHPHLQSVRLRFQRNGNSCGQKRTVKGMGFRLAFRSQHNQTIHCRHRHHSRHQRTRPEYHAKEPDLPHIARLPHQHVLVLRHVPVIKPPVFSIGRSALHLCRNQRDYPAGKNG